MSLHSGPAVRWGEPMSPPYTSNDDFGYMGHPEAISRAKKGRDCSRPVQGDNTMKKAKTWNAYLAPKPADCIDCREMSEVEAMPCMRSLKSSALEAFSRAVS